jgi:phospholipid/cholesterol/gamma-HCH transport system substrate-binding protein
VRHAIKHHMTDFLALLGVFAIGIAIGAYILSNQRLRFPIVEDKPFVVKAELSDAQAVTPGQGQTVRVAGVRIGDIGEVELDDGRAVVELQLDKQYEGLLRDDATALLRSKTGSKDMFVEVDPGEGEPLEDGERITVQNTAPDIDPDEVLDALDADTRDYLKLLVSGAGKGLDGRGTDLRETLRRLGPLHRDAAAVTQAIARRRSNMRRLVNRYGKLTEHLGRSDRDITRLVRASNAALGAFADEDDNVSALVSRLPGALRETQATLAKVDTLGGRMRPAFEALRPPLRKLDAANRATRPFVEDATPVLRDEVRPFARAAQPFNAELGVAARDLSKAGPDLTGTFKRLNRFFNIGAYNPNGTEEISDACERQGQCTREERARNESFLYWLAWLGQANTSLFSTSDALGPFRRAWLLGLNCAIERQITDQLEPIGGPLVDEVQQNLEEALNGLGACAG